MKAENFTKYLFLSLLLIQSSASYGASHHDISSSSHAQEKLASSMEHKTHFLEANTDNAGTKGKALTCNWGDC